jgi:hypothetical protein
MPRSVARLLAVALVSGAFVTWAAGTAAASCNAGRQVSPDAFTGTVLSVELEGRVAHVRTDDGRTVVVRGTDSDSPNAFTSVDRTYSAGARYEFHPINATEPYQDNACTATREIAAPTGTAGGAAPPATDPTRAASGSVLGGAVVAAAAFAAVSVAWLVRRRFTSTSS